MTRDEAVQVVSRLMTDGHRIDRYLRRNPDGEYYTTDAERYDGPHDCADHYMRICVIEESVTDEELESEAESLIALLEEEIAGCEECQEGGVS